MMTASRESVAYKQYEERMAPVQQERTRDLRAVPTPRRRKKAAVRLNVFVCVSVIAIAAVYILFCQMQLTQLTAQVSTQTEALDELAAENVSLSSKQMNSMDMTQVEEYAVNHLGMVNMDNSQIEYVELTNPDTVTVAQSGVSLDALAYQAAAALARREVFLLESEHIAAKPIPVEVHVRAIHQRIRTAKHLRFSQLVGPGTPKDVAVVTFLAILELYKRVMVRLEQDELFGDIAIDYIEGSGDLRLEGDDALTSVGEE